jgi:MFS superfamily sulfate permease-like transporter
MIPGSADIANPSDPTPAQEPIQELYNTKVIQLAFLVACMYTGVGLLRFGWLIHFLSHSVITGFTSGVAIIIALSQVGCSLIGPRLVSYCVWLWLWAFSRVVS